MAEKLVILADLYLLNITKDMYDEARSCSYANRGRIDEIDSIESVS